MMLTGFFSLSPLFPLAATPLIVAVACAVYEMFLAWTRFRLAWLPPVGAALAEVLCLYRLDNSGGLESVYWFLPCIFGGSALAGALLGLPAGAMLLCLRGQTQAAY